MTSAAPPPGHRRPFLLMLAALVVALLPAAPAAADEPAPKPPAGQAPPPAGLVLERAAHDFGAAEQNSEYATTIGYRNTSDRTIRDLRVIADCGCYAATVSSPTLAPAESGEIHIRFRTLTLSGPLTKKLQLVYEDGGPRRVEVPLSIHISRGVLVAPGRVYFGEILEGSKPEGTVKLLWYPKAGQPFKIERVEVAGEPIQTTVTPYTNPEDPDRKGWRILFRFTEPPPRGLYSKKATVHLTHPQTKTVRVALSAHVVGRVWVQSSRIHLGLVAQGEGKSATVLLRHFDKNIPLGKISGQSRKGILQVTIEDTMTEGGPGGPPKPAKLLRVTVPPGAPAGALNDDIDVRTTVPGEENLVIQVRGRVYKRITPAKDG